MGASQVLLHSLELANAPYKPMGAYRFSLLNLLPSGPDLDHPIQIQIPETHLVGVGAVGSAMIYTLAHLDDAIGHIHLIDNERLDDTNLNRYMLARRRDLGCWKVNTATAALRNTSIRTKSYRVPFNKYVEEYGSLIDLLLTPVDSEQGRRSLAMMLPRRIINAATGGTTVTLSTHGFGDGKACLHCLYLPKVNQLSAEEQMASDMGLAADVVHELVGANTPLDRHLVAQIERNRRVDPGTWTSYVGLPIGSFYVKAVCGDAEIRLRTANVIAPLPFISATAGILLATELLKANHPVLGDYALDNYVRFDTLELPNPAFRRTRLADPSEQCVCQDRDYVDVYVEKYVRS